MGDAARLAALRAWVAREDPDVLCLQEHKLQAEGAARCEGPSRFRHGTALPPGQPWQPAVRRPISRPRDLLPVITFSRFMR